VNRLGRSRRTVPNVPAALVGVVVAAVALAGCGGGGDESAARVAQAPSTTTVPPVTTPPTSGAPVTTTGALPAVDHTYAVGVRTDTYVDPSRATSAIPGFGGAPSRTFPVTVWYPATGDPNAAVAENASPDRSGGPYPLVVFAHGYAVTPAFYSELLERWAAAGYVVAAPTYPLLSGVPAGPSHEDYDMVFADTTFVLTRLLADVGRGPGPHPLAGLVDPNRVGAAGQSDGEVVSYGLGSLVCCRDPRVKSVISMAGILGNVANPVQRDNGVPVLHLMGSADELQPYDEAITWDRENLGAPRWMVTLVGGNHDQPYRNPASPYFEGVVRTTTDFLDGTLKGRPERLARIDAYVNDNGARFRLER
jgi:dienelactone hydrolase